MFYVKASETNMIFNQLFNYILDQYLNNVPSHINCKPDVLTKELAIQI